ncbi:MAG: hypothetical protein WC797_02880, partial [Candidatus Paceibacterota bacterium]
MATEQTNLPARIPTKKEKRDELIRDTLTSLGEPFSFFDYSKIDRRSLKILIFLQRLFLGASSAFRWVATLGSFIIFSLMTVVLITIPVLALMTPFIQIFLMSLIYVWGPLLLCLGSGLVGNRIKKITEAPARQQIEESVYRLVERNYFALMDKEATAAIRESA